MFIPRGDAGVLLLLKCGCNHTFKMQKFHDQKQSQQRLTSG